MKRVTTATSHHSGWLSLFCISLLLSSFVALPMIEDVTRSQQAESDPSQRLVQTNPTR
jgi:type III secretory pathway component EscR